MDRKKHTFIMNLERMNMLSSEGCPACGHPFSLGDPVVIACGAWEGGPKVIHEYDAVYDPGTDSYLEKRCFAANRADAGGPLVP